MGRWSFTCRKCGYAWEERPPRSVIDRLRDSGDDITRWVMWGAILLAILPLFLLVIWLLDTTADIAGDQDATAFGVMLALCVVAVFVIARWKIRQ